MRKIFIQKSETATVHGIYSITKSKSCTCDRAIKGWKCRHVIGGKYRPIIEVRKSKNLVMQGSYTGSNQFLKRLIGDTTYTGTINYLAIGTGSTAPAVSDTQLQTEVARALYITREEISTTQARIKTFFTDANLTNGTYYEIGSFIDGTASANTGKIFNRALFGTPYAKSSGTDTTIQLDIYFA